MKYEMNIKKKKNANGYNKFFNENTITDKSILQKHIYQSI